jgi:hypothetical protein
VQASEKNIRGHRARLQHFQKLFPRRLNDDPWQPPTIPRVTITPSSTANLEGHTNAYTITNLQQGQTYQINSSDDTDDDYTNDVTGTLINSDKPIAVFAGANLALVPDLNYDFGNPLVQQQLPVAD